MSLKVLKFSIMVLRDSVFSLEEFGRETSKNVQDIQKLALRRDCVT